MPRLSVVVAARNEAGCIGACLDALLRQDVAAGTLEIVVADDASTDETAALAARRGVRCLRLPRSGPAQARNLGVQASRGAIVAFIDADAVPAPDWARALLAAFETIDDPRLAGLGGPQAGHPDDANFARDLGVFLRAIGFVADYVKPHAAVTRVGHNASCNSAYKREIFLHAGGFRPGLFPGEDVDLDKRLTDAGFSVWFTPTARIAHRRPPNARAWLRMLASYARSQADCLAIHGFFRLLHGVPFAWLAGLIVLVLFPRPTLAALTAAVLGMALALRLRHGLALGRGLFCILTTGLVYPPVFLARLATRRWGLVRADRRPVLPPLARAAIPDQDAFSTSTRAS
ncbi:MAG: glycosyltransferase [Solidesulfovibrio sp. DCME]|uniref:glycosyltransferase n=1 Tax=Solidesulfovibrio sp. DCME TaxID=3447380 RepID=UPI003D0FDA5B